MKTMTCRQLGGACGETFQASSFEELVEMSKQHGMEMFQKQDADHFKAIMEVQALMLDPEAMAAWMADKKKQFEALPDD
jgi:predicted small metal-binding protein